MEEYRDLDLTIAVFTRHPRPAEAARASRPGSCCRPTCLTRSGRCSDLQEWATQRRAEGGAAIKVRVVKGANLAMEHVDAAMHDWPLATYGTKQDSDTNYKRVLDWAMTPERLDAVRIGVAGHNLFDIALRVAASPAARGVDRPHVEFEMLLGMATGQAEAVRARTSVDCCSTRRS